MNETFLTLNTESQSTKLHPLVEKDARKKQFTFYSRIHPEYLLKIIYIKFNRLQMQKGKLKLSRYNIFFATLWLLLVDDVLEMSGMNFYFFQTSTRVQEKGSKLK